MPTRRAFLWTIAGLPGLCVAQSADASFTVSGRVRYPGKYNRWAGMRVSDALTPAGGLLDSADDRNIVVIRARERHHFNYRNYKAGKRTAENILLEDGDVIVVP